MNCEKYQPKYIEYINNELTPDEKQEMETHLNTCEYCLKEVAALKSLHDLMEDVPELEPSHEVRKDFYAALDKEKNKPSRKADFKINPVVYQIAAGIALFIIGTFFGMKVTPAQNGINTNQVAELKSELMQTKQLVMLSMLNQDSPSKRIQAVGYSEDFVQPSQEVLDALFKTLNTDDNVNVRLAAANSLTRFAGDKQVRDQLIKSLEEQNDPMIQIILIKIMVQLEEVNAVQQFEKIMNKSNTHEIVKEEAQKAIEILT